MHVSNPGPHSKLRPLPLGAATIRGGFWAKRQATNRQITLLDGYRKLEQAGNFANLRHAAGLGDEPWRGPVFMDEDVYKWLEGVSYEIANSGDATLTRLADETIALLAAAQDDDGYLDSYYQVAEPAARWTDLDHGHELYCAGHLFQAAVAHHRATGSDALLNIAVRLADHIASIFGPDRRQGTCGHPEVEMALVELYRETGERRYLDLAGFFVDQRGKGQMRGLGQYGPEYHQDRVPVREATVAEGHAVRQLYLAAGVADIYLETGEAALLDAMGRVWRDAVGHKMFVTGGYGTRFEGENFGDPYELPSDQCYCETCAAIAAMMWNWRMLLATGEARYADTLERSLYNNFLSGVAADGSHYFYVNPLQARNPMARADWYRVACCPPNIMRQIAAVAYYVATHSDAAIQIQQYMDSSVRVETANGVRALRLRTEYPWDGRVSIGVTESDGQPWQLALRVPSWASTPALSVNGDAIEATASDGYLTVTRRWQAGDTVELVLPLSPYWIRPNPRVDAIRGSLALARGPVVYCLESIDQQAGADLLDLEAAPGASIGEEWRPDQIGGIVALAAPGALAGDGWGDSLYRPLGDAVAPASATTLNAIPYFAWANRGPSTMRVWIAQAPK